MKKSFMVHFPFKQSILSEGLSWAQINELSWEEVNLLSWHDITRIVKRYLDYSIQFTKKLSTQTTFSMKHTLSTSFIKKLSIEILFTLKKVFTVR